MKVVNLTGFTVLINKTIEGTITYGHAVNSTVTLIGMILAVVLMMNLHYTKLGSRGCHTVKTDFVTFICMSTHFVSKNLIDNLEITDRHNFFFFDRESYSKVLQPLLCGFVLLCVLMMFLWIELAQDRDRWQAVVNTVMNLWVS